MTLKTEGDIHVVVTRHFAAPPEAVYRAHTDPKLIQKWLLGPEGWTMPVCISEAKLGGKIRYEWSNEKGQGFFLTGEYLELEPFSRIVHVERMHLPDPTPDNHVETRFDADNYTLTIASAGPGGEDVEIAVFDKVTVNIEVEKDKNTQRGKVKMSLAKIDSNNM